MQTFSALDRQERPVQVYLWACEGRPKAIVQIAHGMAEHCLRYAPFAEALAAQGYGVCAADHPGHGVTTDSQELGYFGPAGLDGAIERMACVTDLLRARYPGVPIVLLGHSMGSFMTRVYLTRYGQHLQGVILMGTGGPNAAADKALHFVDGLIRLQGERKRSKLLNTMMFGQYCRRCPKEEGTFAWLSRDRAVVRAYEEDPYCGFLFTLNGFKTLLSAVTQANSADCIAQTPKDLPLLLISGDEDPVGDYGQGVRKVETMLKQAGCHVTCVLLKGYRHEVLNEADREMVYDILVDFIERKVCFPFTQAGK